MNQRKYALGLVSELGLAGCKPSSTPLEFNHKLTSTVFDEVIGKNTNVEDLILDEFGKYQRLVGKLLYLTMTRPDLSFVVQVLSQYMHSPNKIISYGSCTQSSEIYKRNCKSWIVYAKQQRK